MEELHLGIIETRFAEIIWQNAPMTLRELVKKCEEELQWKRTTTYTVLTKLCNRGFFKSEKRIVTVLISQEEYNAIQSEHFVNETFKGSFSAFVAAFTSRKALSEEEMQELRNIVESFEE